MNEVRDAGVQVIYIAHDKIQQKEDLVNGITYQYMSPKIPPSVWGEIEGEVDDVFYIGPKMVEVEGSSRVINEGMMIFTKPTERFHAGTRMDLPEEMPLDWSVYKKHLAKHFQEGKSK